ncbi:SiaC family regulatory phosphoprotein [Symbiopectobacterium purcellii]
MFISPGQHPPPSVDFYFDTHRLSLSCESYPENAAAFYSQPT